MKIKIKTPQQIWISGMLKPSHGPRNLLCGGVNVKVHGVSKSVIKLLEETMD